MKTQTREYKSLVLTVYKDNYYNIQYKKRMTQFQCERKELFYNISMFMAGKPITESTPGYDSWVATYEFYELPNGKTYAADMTILQEAEWSKDSTSFVYDIAMLYEDIERANKGEI